MKLEDLKIIDVIQMPLFIEQIKARLDEVFEIREKFEAKGAKFKRGPIERLDEMRAFRPQVFASLYAKALNKDLDKEQYPTKLRAFIKMVGDEAFHQTIQILKKQEQNEKDA